MTKALHDRLLPCVPADGSRGEERGWTATHTLQTCRPALHNLNAIITVLSSGKNRKTLLLLVYVERVLFILLQQ
jgi:hypothetical protein